MTNRSKCKLGSSSQNGVFAIFGRSFRAPGLGGLDLSPNTGLLENSRPENAGVPWDWRAHDPALSGDIWGVYHLNLILVRFSHICSRGTGSVGLMVASDLNYMQACACSCHDSWFLFRLLTEQIDDDDPGDLATPYTCGLQ